MVDSARGTELELLLELVELLVEVEELIEDEIELELMESTLELEARGVQLANKPASKSSERRRF
jgi:hypothetical protein